MKVKLRKLISLMLTISHIPIVIVLFFLRKIFKISVVYIDCATAGHFYMDANIYTILKKVNHSIMIAAVGPIDRISNNYWFELVKKEFIYYKMSIFLYKASKLINLSLDDVRSREKGSLITSGIEYFYKDFSIKMPQADNEFCENWLIQKGWRKEKIVIVVLRDSKWYSVVNHDNSDKFTTTRDLIPISDLIETVQYLLDNGYFVVRAGKEANEKFPISHLKFLDYPFLEDKDDRINVWLYMNSFLNINTGTGPGNFSCFYNVHMLWLGAHSLAYQYTDFGKTVLPAKIFHKEGEKPICLFHQLLVKSTNLELLKKYSFSIKMPTSHEILQSTISCISRINGVQLSKAELKAQNDFHYIVQYWNQLFSWKNEYNNWKNFKYQPLKNPNYFICPKFLNTMDEDYFQIDYNLTDELIQVSRLGF